MKSTLLVSTLVGGLLLIEALVSAVSSELRPQVHSLRLDRGRQQNALQAQLQPSNAYYLESQSLLQSIETRPHHHLDPHPHPHPGHHHKSYDLNSDGSKDGQQQDPQVKSKQTARQRESKQTCHLPTTSVSATPKVERSTSRR